MAQRKPWPSAVWRAQISTDLADDFLRKPMATWKMPVSWKQDKHLQTTQALPSTPVGFRVCKSTVFEVVLWIRGFGVHVFCTYDHGKKTARCDLLHSGVLLEATQWHFVPQQQNAMGSLHNIDFGVFWASWGGSWKEPGLLRPLLGPMAHCAAMFEPCRGVAKKLENCFVWVRTQCCTGWERISATGAEKSREGEDESFLPCWEPYTIVGDGW